MYLDPVKLRIKSSDACRERYRSGGTARKLTAVDKLDALEEQLQEGLIVHCMRNKATRQKEHASPTGLLGRTLTLGRLDSPPLVADTSHDNLDRILGPSSVE